MSRAVGYICMSHNTNLASEHWFNQADNLLTAVFVIERAGKWPSKPLESWQKPGNEEPVEIEYEGHYNSTNAPIYWLRQHPECHIGIEDEYGKITTMPQHWTPVQLSLNYIRQMDELQSLIDMIKTYAYEEGVTEA